ncbi:MAG: sulfatase-like hydrolase/transferase [Bacteroidales bacterium]
MKILGKNISVFVKTFIIIGVMMYYPSQAFAQTSKIERVIVFMIDGMHWQAPERLKMPVLNTLIQEGTYIKKSYVIMPHHPTIGDYSTFNSCSFPNPMFHEGTIFIKPENKFLQEKISPKFQTAFVVNTSAYNSVGRGFSTTIMDQTLTDDQVVEQAIGLLENQNLRFMRIHLQSPGSIGQAVVSASTPDKPYYKNIYGEKSPYVSAIENADRQLGKFIAFLKKSGKWESTVLIVTSDHGQSLIGWHPLFDEDSWVTPLLFVGPGIAKDRKLPYFEHTDMAPTIAWLLGVEAPNKDGGAGKAVKEIMESTDATNYQPPMLLKKIDEQIKEFNILKSELTLAAEKDRTLSNVIASLENENITPEPFYHQDRITQWYQAGTTQHMIDANEKILQEMRDQLKNSK